MAEDDLARWQAAASQILPLVQLDACAANVRYLASADGWDVARYEVELSWQERESTEPSNLVGVLLVAVGERA